MRKVSCVLPGGNPARLCRAGGAHRAACLSLKLVVESVRRRVHPANRDPPHRSHRISRTPSRARADCDSELLIRCSKRLWLAPSSPLSVSTSVKKRSALHMPFRSDFGRCPRQWFQRRSFASPRSAKQTLRSIRCSKTRHTRTRLCHRTHPLVHPYLFVFASAPIPKFRCSMSPQCIRSCEVFPVARRETKSLSDFTSPDPPGRAFVLRHVHRTS